MKASTAITPIQAPQPQRCFKHFARHNTSAVPPDINGFKPVNNHYSHTTLTRVLLSLGAALTCSLAVGTACAAELAQVATSHGLASETGALLSAGVIGLVAARRQAGRQT